MSPAEPEDVVEAPDPATHDDAIRAVVSRLARPHASGGMVVERAALLAEGADFAAVMAWITGPRRRAGGHGAGGAVRRPARGADERERRPRRRSRAPLPLPAGGAGPEPLTRPGRARARPGRP